MRAATPIKTWRPPVCGPQSAAMSSPRAVASPPLLLLALLGAAAALEVAVSYRGFRLLRVSVADVEHSAAVAALVDAGKLSLWAERRRDTADVLAAPAHWDAVQRLFQAVALNYTVLTHDLQTEINKENPPPDYEEDSDFRIGHHLTWHRYHSYADIDSYLVYLAKVYSHMCSIEVIGTSTEGRQLKILKVSKDNVDKPAIWIDAGQHGREWIAPATATFLMLQLVEFQNEHPELLENFDWYIMPVANPDGYEYSRSVDRLWRKTRSLHVGSNCHGVDPNRNWDIHWIEKRRRGNCHEDFAGPKAFSEPETRAAADHILAHNGTIRLYLSLHSYSQMWLIPWSFKKEKPKDYYELYVLAEEGIAALQKERGTEYLLGTAPELIYTATGSSDDWVKGVAGIKYAYTIELPDTGSHGFILPAEEIKPIGQEMWAAVKVMAQKLITS